MTISFAIRYITQRVFWLIVKPIRTCYRFVVRPTYQGAKAILVHEDRVLLVRPNYGHRLWTLPGGGARSGESFEEAAMREVKEEVGLTIQIRKFVREYEVRENFSNTIIRAFTASAVDWHVAIDGIEIKEAAWFPLDSLPDDMVTRSRQTVIAYASTRPEP